MAVILRNGRVAGANANVGLPKYERDSDLLDFPALSNGDEKIYILFKVYEHSNFVTLKATGDYQVDYGDGQAVQTYASNTQANYEIDWNNISASTLTSEGYKQALITITPQSGSQLNTFNVNSIVHPDDLSSYNSSQLSIIEVKMAGQNFTNFNSSFQGVAGIQSFEFVGTAPNLTSASQMFYLCQNLQKVVFSDTSNVTNFYRMFRQCSRLKEVNKLDLSSTTSISQMFMDCSRLRYLEPWDLDNEASSITNLSLAFDTVPLVNVPITSCSNVTNFSGAFIGCKFTEFNLDCSAATIVTTMFSSCSDLVTCGATFPNNLTSTGSMFDSCIKLKYIKPFDTSNVTNSDFMFRANYELEDVSFFDFSSATSMRYMFINCYSLLKSPQQLGGGNLTYFGASCTRLREWGTFNQPVTNLTRAFNSQVQLEVFPNFANGVSGGTSATFTSCYSIITIPSIDFSGITNYSSMFDVMGMLRKSDVTGITISHSYANSRLDRNAIVNVFNNLGTAATGAIITVTNTLGVGDLTASDIAIATGKGWTVTT